MVGFVIVNLIFYIKYIIMSQYIQDKMARLIMCVPSDKLFDEKSFDGFMEHSDADMISKILEHHEYKTRWPLEEDNSYQQPIPYSVIVHRPSKKILAYKRSSNDTAYTEKRLYGKWSFGVGWHIETEDKDNEDPVYTSAIREITEEVWISPDSLWELNLYGYINFNNPWTVDDVHFGVVYVAHVDDDILWQDDGEVENVKFVSIDELESAMNEWVLELESWSGAILEPVKKYISMIS